jgi:hypothetical protein
MGKMYYTEPEAAQKLGVSPADLTKMVSENRLRVYTDGPRKMYKAEEVDALVPSKGESGEVELTPADSSARDAVAITDAARPPGKEDTVITSEGISIFDEEDLEVEAADPMAKTSIAPSVEDQVSAAGVGSGSGLLDLTRESDDTSLGAEVLEHIDVEGGVPGGSSMAAAVEQPAYAEAAIAEMPVVVEEIDPSAGLFAGLAGAACLVMLVMGAVGIAALTDGVPPYLEAMQQNLAVFLVAAVLVAAILGAGGFFIGKSVAARSAALRRGT